MTKPRKQAALRLVARIPGAAAFLFPTTPVLAQAPPTHAQPQTAAPPQPPTPTPPRPIPAFNRNLIFLDPAHGGPDNGAQLADDVLEKEVSLSFTTRLRAALATGGFNIIATRDADPATPIPTDQRADIANHAHPTACLLLHATATGSGIHISTAPLPQADSFDTTPHYPLPWDSAQTTSIPQSLRLANEIGVALLHAKIPVTLSPASIRPLDNLICPAVAIELAPIANGSDTTPVVDAAYQQHAAEAIASALSAWRSHNNPTSTTGAAR